jgi:hypothetical protein
VQSRMARLFGLAPARVTNGDKESMTVAEWAPLVDITEVDKEWVGCFCSEQRVGKPEAGIPPDRQSSGLLSGQTATRRLPTGSTAGFEQSLSRRLKTMNHDGRHSFHHFITEVAVLFALFEKPRAI